MHGAEVGVQPLRYFDDALAPRDNVPGVENDVSFVLVRGPEQFEHRELRLLQLEKEIVPAIQHQRWRLDERRVDRLIYLRRRRLLLETAGDESRTRFDLRPRRGSLRFALPSCSRNKRSGR